MKFKFAPVAFSAALALAAAGLSSVMGETPASADSFNRNAPYQIAQAQPLWQPYHGQWRKLTEHGYVYRSDAPNYRPGVVSGAYGRYGGDQAIWQKHNGGYRRMTEHGWEYRSDAPDYRPGVVTNNYGYHHGYGNGNGGRFYHGGTGYQPHNYAAPVYQNHGGFNSHSFAHSYNGSGNGNGNWNANNHPHFGGGGDFGHHHH